MTAALRSPRIAVTEQPPTAPLGSITPRQVFDELARRRTPTLPEAERRVAEAQLRLFADAVDGTGTGVAYGDAVVIVGDSGTVVAHGRDYADTPDYWHTLAAGSDQPRLIIDGADVITWLHGT